VLLRLAAKSFGLLLLGVDVSQAFLQRGHLAEPPHPVRFVEPFVGVGLDLQQARYLGEVQPQHGAADAGMLVLARCPIWTVAGAEGDLAELEVVAELGPFGVRGLAVLLPGRRARP
jgi:hypothetical protein